VGLGIALELSLEVACGKEDVSGSVVGQLDHLPEGPGLETWGSTD
jgi:hypothetical protein